jgi:BolA protein
MIRKNRIYQKLEAELSPLHLEVKDESSLHDGHAGSRPEGETHYRVIISGGKLDGLSRVASHRIINEVLKDEFASGMHALAIECRA